MMRKRDEGRRSTAELTMRSGLRYRFLIILDHVCRLLFPSLGNTSLPNCIPPTSKSSARLMDRF